MNPTVLGVIGPGFLNQVPTLSRSWDEAWAWPAYLHASVPTNTGEICIF